MPNREKKRFVCLQFQCFCHTKLFLLYKFDENKMEDEQDTQQIERASF